MYPKSDKASSPKTMVLKGKCISEQYLESFYKYRMLGLRTCISKRFQVGAHATGPGTGSGNHHLGGEKEPQLCARF